MMLKIFILTAFTLACLSSSFQIYSKRPYYHQSMNRYVPPATNSRTFFPQLLTYPSWTSPIDFLLNKFQDERNCFADLVGYITQILQIIQNPIIVCPMGAPDTAEMIDGYCVNEQDFDDSMIPVCEGTGGSFPEVEKMTEIPDWPSLTGKYFYIGNAEYLFNIDSTVGFYPGSGNPIEGGVFNFRRSAVGGIPACWMGEGATCKYFANLDGTITTPDAEEILSGLTTVCIYEPTTAPDLDKLNPIIDQLEELKDCEI